MEEFLNYLRTQTSLNERSIKFYYWVIKNFLAKYKEPTIENINARIREYPATKFAFYHYLRFLGRENDYNKLIKTKPKPKEKKGVYLQKEILMKIISSIPDEKYRMVALLQYLTGARVAEILKLKKEDFDPQQDMLKIKLVTKGNYERIVFVPQEYKDLIMNFVKNSKFDYPFLKGDFNKPLAKLVYNNYIYYYTALKKAASDLGYENFATHDFRRNFIDRVLDVTSDIRIARALIGHARAETTLRYISQKSSEEEFKKFIKSLV